MSSPNDPVAERRRELERRLAALSAEARLAVEESWKGDHAAAPVLRDGIPLLSRDAPLPMSYAQELLWLMEENSPGFTYNVPRIMRLQGKISREALQRALDAIVARHEILRTVYRIVEDQPRQVIMPAAGVPLDWVELGSLPAADREANALREIDQRSRRPFDLSSDLQLRATVVVLGPDDHVLLLESHHIASDGWSTSILSRELGALYREFLGGAPASLAPLRVQYADFAGWQRTRLQGAYLEQLLSYWRKQLAGAPDHLDLPIDQPRSGTAVSEGHWASVDLPLELLEGLREVSRRHNATLFMTLLAAFDVLLARASGQDDIVVGSPMGGRGHEESSGIIGYFLNMLVLRVSLADNPGFGELLARVRETVLGAYDHQELPFEKLVTELSRERVIGSGSPFQVMFTLQDPGRDTVQLEGTTRLPFGGYRATTKFDLSLSAVEREECLRLMLEYRVDLFDATTIARMLSQLQVMLEAIARDATTAIGSLPLLREAEQRQMLALGVGPSLPAPAHSTLGAAIVAQAFATPSAVAVEADDGAGGQVRLTYAELHARAADLADQLNREGVGPRVGVAIATERSAEMVVAIVAVLLSGGYYIPIDPEYPADRISFMLHDSAPRVLLTTESVYQQLRGVLERGEAGAPKVLLLSAGTAPHATAREPFPVRSRPEDIAYLIYTSGSTGQPKGAMNSHAAIVNRLKWMQHEYRLTPHDVVLQKTPFSFDVSVWEFLWPLLNGAKLVMAIPGGHRDTDYLSQVIVSHGITICHFVPSMLRAFLDNPAAAGCMSLREVMASGEALPPDVVAAFYRALPSARLHNLYGPTECAVDVSYWPCPPSVEPPLSVPIGRPVANTRLYILDEQKVPVPTGFPGELHIGGRQVGVGYLGRPELTAERFTVDPFAPEPGARMYRTGDRARWRVDGTIEYLGRLDHQVKLRGNRIELGEIETELTRLPTISAAVVVVREDAPGDQRLVGYVVPAGSAVVDAAEVRTQLRARLPEAMIPAAIVTLDSLPLSPNGKLDRRALPSPAASERFVEEAYVAPRTPIEEELATVWASILKVSRVGADDDFFDLGGNSLLALRMMAEMQRLWGRRIPLQALFEHSTVAQFAEMLVAGTREEEERGVVVLQADGKGTPLAFVHGDVLGFGWFCRRLAPLLGGSPMMVLPTFGPTGPDAPGTIEAMARAHLTTVRRLQPIGPYRLGGYCHGGLIAYEMARLLEGEGERVETVILVDAFAPNLRFVALDRVIRRLTSRASSIAEAVARAKIFYRLHYYPWRFRVVRRMPLGEKLRWAAALLRRRFGPSTSNLHPTVAHPVSGKAAAPATATPARNGLGPVGEFVAVAQRAYLPGPYAGRVDLIWGSRARKGGWKTVSRGWERVATDLHSRVIEGDHMSIVTPDGLPQLAQAIRDLLDGEQ